MKSYNVGTRNSRLALLQTKKVIEKLTKICPNSTFHIKRLSTEGDRHKNIPLTDFSHENVFTTDIETALLNKKIDFAVHSLKDLPSKLKEPFTIEAYVEREDSRDVFIAREGVTLATLHSGAIIGTSSSRRTAQIKHMYPNVFTKPIRGTVKSRLKQLKDGKYDGIILAAAGLIRLGLQSYITHYFPFNNVLPAAGQGVIVTESLRSNEQVNHLLRQINDEQTEQEATLERDFIDLLNTHDQVPIGIKATVNQAEVILQSSIMSLNGQHVLHDVTVGQSRQEVLEQAFSKLKEQGLLTFIHEIEQELRKQ